MNKPGVLYITATPIGNLGDMSYRAIEVLQTVAVIAAEDTRHSKRLLQHFNIETQLISLHEHNEEARIPALLQRIQAGDCIALISDAGTPLISDPGYRLVCAARAADINVIPIPGPCAMITALSAAGMPADRFMFEGFLPSKKSARLQRLTALQAETHTLIFYEAPHRIERFVTQLIEVFGPTRQAVLARELTKKFENIHGDTLENLQHWLQADKQHCRGEFVVLVRGQIDAPAPIQDSEKILTLLLAELPLKQAVKIAAKITGENKNALYKMAIEKTNRRLG